MIFVKLNNRINNNEKSLWLFSLLISVLFFICTLVMLTSCSVKNNSEERNTDSNTSTSNIVPNISKTSMMSTIQSITKEERPINSTYLSEVCLHLQNEFNKLGYSTTQQKFDYNDKQNEFALRRSHNPEVYFASTVIDGKIDGSGTNIIAYKNSPKENAKTLIISAHYDSYTGSIGANDNASGVAAILEVSRLLKDVELAFNLHFILFSGEEKWMLGSRWYLGNLTKDEKEKIIGNINIDTIAEKSNLGYWAMVYGNVGTSKDNPIVDPELNKNVMSELFTSNERFKLTVGINSDHYPFALSGIPSVSIIQDLSDGINANSSNDVVETIDSDRLVEVVTCVIESIFQID